MVTRYFSFLLACSVLCSAASLVVVPAAQAQSVIERIQSLFSRTRAEGNASGRARGGAIRSATINDRNLVALMPASNIGSTTEAHPTFWFYVSAPAPDAAGVVPTARTAEFMLLDENQIPILDAPISVPLPSTAGIVSFRLPETLPSLEPGKSYNWFFAVLDRPDQLANDLYVSGWVERIAPDPQLNQQLSATAAGDRYAVYANYDIWYEAVTQLVQNRATHPQEWAQILALFNLQDATQAPVVNLQAQ